MVGLGRFELPTSPLSGVRSNQLSYRPGMHAGRCGPVARIPVFRSSRKGFEDQVNMLSSYAAHDDRVVPEGQRRFDSGSLRFGQEPD
jgi:hypothetical protein